jgi:cell division transport system ATP-binding protein
LADEPTAHLDTKSTTEVLHLFECFRQSGMAVMVASHDLTAVARMKNRVLILERGGVNS